VVVTAGLIVTFFMLKFVMLKKHWIFIINLLIFALLLAKNPFSERSLIPNFEPYPDTIHYVNSARSFIEGHGLQIYREGRALKTNVPPLYSLVLMPLFLIYNDPRMFYFTNVILALLSFFLFYKILRKILIASDQRLMLAPRSLGEVGTNYLIIFITLFLYATNYFFYWYPTLAMAENLALTLFMGAIYLLLIPLSKKNAVYASLISVAFYATKYASIPLTGFFFLSYLAKIYLDQRYATGVKKNIKLYFILIFSSVFLFFIYSLWEWYAKGSTLLVSSIKSTSSVSSGGWFSLAYVNKYLPHYLRALAGGERIRFLWDDTPIVPIYVGISALIGFIFGVIQKQTRFITISLLLMLFSSILFMSSFYSQDMRYLYHAIPTLLLGFALFWKTVLSFTLPLSFPRRRESSLIFIFLLIALFLFYLFTNAIRLKKQIMLNLKYVETPWYYISVLELNKYFATPPNPDKKPIVISSMSPYYIDFFSNRNYSLLPLSLSQDFWNTPKEAWGNFDYSNLITLYHKALLNNYPIYVHNYGLGNEQVLRDDFKKIQDTFKLELVQTGCFNACNIWRLRERD